MENWSTVMGTKSLLIYQICFQMCFKLVKHNSNFLYLGTCDRCL